MAVWAFTLAQQPLPELTGDPHIIMRRSLRVARTGDIFNTNDSPLRYAPLATLFRLLGVQETDAQAEFVTHFYSTFMSYIAVPGMLYFLLRETIDNRVATLTVLGFATWRIFDIGLSPYQHGYWMYDYAIPFVYLALLVLHRMVLATEPNRKLLGAALAGLVIGIVGLNQYMLGAYTSVFAAVLYVLYGDYRELAMTGGIGAAMASSIFFMSDYAKDLIFSTGSGRLEFIGWGALPDHIASTITTPA